MLNTPRDFWTFDPLSIYSQNILRESQQIKATGLPYLHGWWLVYQYYKKLISKYPQKYQSCQPIAGARCQCRVHNVSIMVTDTSPGPGAGGPQNFR